MARFSGSSLNGKNGVAGRNGDSRPFRIPNGQLANSLNPQRANSHERPAFERGMAILRRNWLLIAICIVTVPAAALVYSLLQTKQYTASASLLFGATSLDQRLQSSSLSEEADPERVAATNLKLVSLRRVAVLTADALDRPGLSSSDVSDKIEVNPEGESDLVSVEATDESPEFAAELANTFARQYILFRRNADRAKVVRAQSLIDAQLAELTPSARESEVGEDLEQRRRQLEVLGALQTGNAELVQPADAPDSPSSPKTARNVALGLLLGIFLGIGLALLREQLDRRIRDIDDVEEVFGLPVLGTIPQSRAIPELGPGAELPSTGMESEAFRMLRANLRYFNIDREITSILITSAAPQDGKTTVSWNIALADARAEERVLLVEADLRRPTIAQNLGLPTPEKGLSLVLAGVAEPAEAIQNVHGVDLMPAGPLPPNPAELIESKRMAELLTWAEQEYDRVILDTPPAAVVADALSLFSRVGGVVIVTRLLQSPRGAAEDLRDQLANTGAPVLGMIVNSVPAPPESTYYRSQATESFPANAAKTAAVPPAESDDAAEPATEPQSEPAPTGKSPGSAG
jgi:succinoglycan biosynthesis transport protein ExoP